MVRTLQNEYGAVSVDTVGARVVSWIPQGQEEVVFMPQTPVPNHQPPITIHRQPITWRHGGIPVCFPWFGTNGPAGSPMHGLVCGREWTVVRETPDRLVLQLASDSAMKTWFAGDFTLTLEVTLSESLALALTVENTGREPFAYTDGFHPYFRVADCARAQVTGLEGCRYWFLTGFADEPQNGPLAFGDVRDNVYWTDGHRPVLADPLLRRRIAVAATGNRRFVVWNPGPEGDEGLAADDWRRFVCVEPATLPAADAFTIRPGEKQTLEMRVSIERIR